MTIDEKYLKTAINIRRTYLKLINNVDLYKDRATQVSDKLEETINKLNSFKDEISDKHSKKNITEKEGLNKLLEIINDIDEEGKKLEKLIAPINTEIEKLAKEEQELYRQIVEHHYNLTEDEIVSIVRDRLIQEGLS